MSTLRISNIEAKADNSSPTVDEQLKFTNSTGDVLLHLDGRTSGITTVGINTTAQTIKFDENNNVFITGIVTATELHGTVAVGTSVTYGDNEKAYFGTGLDLSIFHNNSDSVISQSASGTGNLKILSGGAQSIECIKAGAVNISHNGTTKLATTSNGVTVTGRVDPAADSTHDLGTTSVRWRNVYADTLYGSGANLTSLPAQATIANNADNRIITGGSGVNLNGEANLTYDGTTLQVQSSGSGLRELLRLKNSNASAGVSGLYFNSTTSGSAFDAACVRNGVNGSGQGRLFLQTNNGSGLVNGLEIEYDGQVTLPTNSLNILDSIVHIGDTNTKIRFPSADTISFETGGTERLRIATDSNITQTIDSDGDGFIITAGDMKPMLTGNSNRSNHNNTIFGISGKWNNTEVGRIAFEAGADTTNKDDGKIRLYTRPSSGSLTQRLSIESDGHILPGADNGQDLGSSSKRWRDIYTGDLNLSNEGSTNDVDATWGNYTIQEGESDLFLINNRSGKKYKFNLTEVS